MKKIISGIAIIILSAILAICASAATYKKGDANMDGNVNASDARLVLRASAMLDNFSDAQILICDMNDNGKIQAADARIVLRVAARLEGDKGTVTIGENAADNQDASSSKPGSSTNNNQSSSSKPGSSTNNNQSSSSKPGSSTNNNQSSSSKPGSSTNNNQSSSSKPGSSTNNNQSSSSKPGSSTNNNQSSSSKPDSSTNNNQSSSSKPGSSTNNNQSSSSKPGSSTNNNQSSSSKPGSSANKQETTTVPITNEAFKKLPAQAKAFLLGEFGLKGYMYDQDQKDEFVLFCSENAIKIGLPKELPNDLLITDINGNDPKVYLVTSPDAEEKIAMMMPTAIYDDLGLYEIIDLAKQFGVADVNKLEITEDSAKENNTTYTVYKISAKGENIEIYMIGDDIKRIYTYDSIGNITMRMDVDTFYAKVPSSELSIDEYEIIDLDAI